MTSHGFKGIKLYTEKATLHDKDEIAKCISNIPGVLWAHVVHKGFSYDSREEETLKLREDPQVQNRYDLLIEMTRKCDLEAIEECAREHGHKITIELIIIKDQSWHKGKPGKHPKEKD